MLRSILAILAASIITFLWGWLSWGVFGWHEPQPFTNPDAVAEVLKANTSGHGMYAYPTWSEMQDPEKSEAYMQTWSAGPAIYAMVRPGPNQHATMASGMIQGFLINVLASTALLLLIQKSGHSAFLDRLSIALLAGLFLGLISALYPWNWMEYPGLETIATLADGIIPWTLAGAAIAAILPKRSPA